MKYCLMVYFVLGLITYPKAQVSSVNYRSPLEIDLLVNGTFGELRSNHFHSGIDFATQRKTGFPVYAVEDGVVNRIKVSAFGYGNVLYIRHTNGYTSVYAHLERFAAPISNYVKKEQYAANQFEIELFPIGTELLVKKGDIIGYSGNTGSSGGPHLHFELRDTSTEDIINPFSVGMFSEIVDTQKPIINGLWVYPYSPEVQIMGVSRPVPLDYKRMSNGDYLAEKIYTNGSIGFGINSYDISDGSTGKNGVYEILLKVNGSIYAHVAFDRFSFDKTRYINHYIDFAKYTQDGQRIQKLFNKNLHDIPLFKKLKKEGFLEVLENKDYQVVIEVSDFHKNKQVIHIPVSYKAYDSIPTPTQKGKWIDYYRDYIFEENSKYVEWKAGTFYEDQYLDITLSTEEVKLLPETIPVHTNIDIRFDTSTLDIDTKKAFIARIDGKKIIYNDTWKRGNEFRIRTKNMGIYRIEIDSISPTIQNKSKIQLTMEDDLIFEINDDLSGIGDFYGTINGNWALFSYDYKTKCISHTLSDQIAVLGENILILHVKDKIGNNSTFEYPFTILK